MYKVDLLGVDEWNIVKRIELDKVKIEKRVKNILEERFKFHFGDRGGEIILSDAVKLIAAEKLRREWEELTVDLAGRLYMDNELGSFISTSNLKAHGISDREVYRYFAKLVICDH